MNDMASLESQIISDIIGTLQSTGLFVRVDDGEIKSDAAVPAAAIINEGWQEISQRGMAEHFEKLCTMAIRIVIHTRSSKAGEGIARLTELAGGVADALMVDSTRGGLCCDLPEGRKATSITRLQIDDFSDGIKRQLSLHIECHFRKARQGTFSGPTIDGNELFTTGPSEIVCEGWPRQMIRRGFSGINGEALLDMGSRGRRLTQRGILSGATAELLQQQIDAVNELADGKIHRLVDSDGVVFQKVVMENFQPTTPMRNCGVFRCEYETIYRQLP